MSFLTMAAATTPLRNTNYENSVRATVDIEERSVLCQKQIRCHQQATSKNPADLVESLFNEIRTDRATATARIGTLENRLDLCKRQITLHRQDASGHPEVFIKQLNQIQEALVTDKRACSFFCQLSSVPRERLSNFQNYRSIESNLSQIYTTAFKKPQELQATLKTTLEKIKTEISKAEKFMEKRASDIYLEVTQDRLSQNKKLAAACEKLLKTFNEHSKISPETLLDLDTIVNLHIYIENSLLPADSIVYRSPKLSRTSKFNLDEKLEEPCEVLSKTSKDHSETSQEHLLDCDNILSLDVQPTTPVLSDVTRPPKPRRVTFLSSSCSFPGPHTTPSKEYACLQIATRIFRRSPSLPSLSSILQL